MTSLTQAIAQFATSGLARQAPRTVRDIINLSLLDWAACALAGQDEPVAQRVRALVASEAGAPQALVIGGPRAPMRAAALANGTISHALDYDDTHFLHIGHPAVVIFPACLAIAETQKVKGTQFLEAALIGYETSCRIGDWLGRQHYEMGFHQTATAGAFGAGVAAAVLLGLDAHQIANCIGIVATRASGVKAQFGTDGKPFNAGIAAANGVEAALLSQYGFVSNPEALTAPQGFGQTHGAQDKSLDLVLEGLGSHWHTPHVQHKLHACCHGLHASLEALSQLGTPIPAAELKDVTIHTHPRWLDVCNHLTPKTGLEAKFSYRLTSAMALAGVDTAQHTIYSDALCTQPELVALRDKVHVMGDAALRDMQARVQVRLRNGRSFCKEHDLATLPDVVSRQSAILRKTQSLLGDAAAQRLWTAIKALEEAQDIGDFLAALKRGF